MSTTVNITKTKGFKRLLIILWWGIIFLGLFFYKNVWGAVPFSDDFENYELSSLNNQYDWIAQAYFNVVDSNPHAGLKSVETTQSFAHKTGQMMSEGIWSIFIYRTQTGSYAENFSFLVDDVCGTIAFKNNIAYIQDMPAVLVQFDNEILNEWFKLSVNFDWNTGKYQARLNENEWSEWVNLHTANCPTGWNRLYWYHEPTGYYTYVDDIGENGVPPEMRIWGIDPESGTEITNLNTTLTIGYEGFDWYEYRGFTIAFLDERLHASSQTKIYVSEDLDPDGSGQIEVNLQDFNLDRKGKWYLTALGFGTHLDIEGGMFLTTRGYVDFWVGVPVSPEYYLLINVEGLQELYPVSDFDTWYGINVSRYEAPTDEASSIAGFIQPIMEIGGEFSNRAFEIFTVNEAFDRGFSLGEVFPIISGYVGAISYFFGSFPLTTWLKYIIILLFGMFLIKAVLKFIPFLGK